MFFLVVLVWSTLTTEPPKVVAVFKTLDECLATASKANKADLFGPPREKYVCAQARGET